MGASLCAGRMTRVWLDAVGSIRSVCTSVLAVAGCAEAESMPSCSVVAETLAGGEIFAAAVGVAVPGRGGATGVCAASSVANCSAVGGVVGSFAVAGSTLGQATRELIFSASRAGRRSFAFAVIAGRRLVAGCAVFTVGWRCAPA